MRSSDELAPTGGVLDIISVLEGLAPALLARKQELPQPCRKFI